MRPDGPRDPTAGPDEGPEQPFPLWLDGTVIKGFGRGSKEVSSSCSACFSGFVWFPPCAEGLECFVFALFFGRLLSLGGIGKSNWGDRCAVDWGGGGSCGISFLWRVEWEWVCGRTGPRCLDCSDTNRIATARHSFVLQDSIYIKNPLAHNTFFALRIFLTRIAPPPKLTSPLLTQLGIPTANIPISGLSVGGNENITSGVYYGWAGLSPNAALDDPASPAVFPMVMSIGWNPFYKNTVRSVEVHIMHDFKRDFYGSHMNLVILGFIRPEYDYVSVESLVEDIRTDIDVAGRSLERAAYKRFREEEGLREFGGKTEVAS